MTRRAVIVAALVIAVAAAIVIVRLAPGAGWVYACYDRDDRVQCYGIVALGWDR